MKTKDQVGAYEAKTHFPKLLERAEKGGRITITRHGVPVAMLVPFDTADKRNPENPIRELIAFSHRHSLKGTSIREMIDEGRRF